MAQLLCSPLPPPPHMHTPPSLSRCHSFKERGLLVQHTRLPWIGAHTRAHTHTHLKPTALHKVLRRTDPRVLLNAAVLLSSPSHLLLDFWWPTQVVWLPYINNTHPCLPVCLPACLVSDTCSAARSVEGRRLHGGLMQWVAVYGQTKRMLPKALRPVHQKNISSNAHSKPFPGPAVRPNQ